MSTEWAELAIEALQALAWPVVVAVLVFRFVGTFQSELARFIGKLTRIETPLGSAEALQGVPSGRVPPLDDSEKEAFEEEIAALEEEIKRGAAQEGQSRDVVHVLSSLATTLRDRLEMKEAEATDWWLRYLSCFLTPDAKRILFFVARHPQGVRDETLRDLAVSAPGAQADVLAALLGEKLMRIEPGPPSVYTLTSAGERFVSHERTRPPA